MKLDDTNANAIVTNNENGVAKASTYKQEQIMTSSHTKSSVITKNSSSHQQTQISQMKMESISNGIKNEMSHQNGSNGHISSANGNVMKVHHATMESVGHEFHQASSMQVQQTGYDGPTLFGFSRKGVSNGQTNTVTNGQHSDSREKMISCPMELPEVKPLPIKSSHDIQNGNSAPPPERKEENNIASDYFQNKYGSENSDNSAKKKQSSVSKQALVNEINSSLAMKRASREPSAGAPVKVNEINSALAMKRASRESSVGAQLKQEVTYKTNGMKSKTTTPRDSRASSVSKQNGGDFSYLSLIPDDGSFPHRTNPIGGPQTSRRNSIQQGQTGRMSKAGSTEHLNHTEKKNFMVRSNPIGLAEPSVKRDGYAVGKDGSFYRSSEHLFENKVSQSTSRASSEAPEGNWRGNQFLHSGYFILCLKIIAFSGYYSIYFHYTF